MSNENEQVVNVNIGQTASGQYKVMVVNKKTGEIKHESPWRRNLILNSGLAMVAYNFWERCMAYCYAGAGSTSNYADSGADTATSDAAGNVTCTAGFNFGAYSVGDCILWDSGESGRITNIGGATSCTITPAPGGAGISAGFFTLLITSRSKLVGPVKRHNVYLAGAPNQVGQRIGNTVVSRQTYDFEEETGGVTIQELGVSATQTGSTTVWGGIGPDLFSRIVLPAPLSLSSGDSLRVVYQLSVTMSPTTPQAATPTITGWPVAPAITTAGTYAVRQCGLSVVLVGATSPSTGSNNLDSYANEPSAIGAYGSGSHVMWVDKTRQGFSFTWPASMVARPGFDLANKVSMWRSQIDFTGLTYSLVKEATWGIGEANYDTWGAVTAMGVGYYSTMMFAESDPTVNCGWYFEFDEDQIKTNVQKLTLRVKYSWSRTLTID